MSTTRSAHQDSFKRKSSTVDKRTIRQHRRSLEWKEMRNVVQNQRRNMELSPVQEAKPAKQDKETKHKNAGSGESRMEKLKKWKEEQLLKKKQDSRVQKKTFCVSHVKPDTLGFNKPVAALAKTVPKAKPTTSTTSQPVSSRTRTGNKKDAKPAAAPKINTRKTKEAPPETVRQTRTTRSAKPVAAPTAGRKTKVAAIAAVPAAKPAARSTRQSTRQKPAAVKPVAAAASGGKKRQRAAPLHITLGRGDASFAPSDFKFQAPSNLPSFQPLTPGSAASFLFQGHDNKPWLSPLGDRRQSSAEADFCPRRCSTPKEKTGRSGKVVHTPVVSAVREVLSSEASDSDQQAGPVQCLVKEKNTRRKSRRSVPATKQDTENEEVPAEPTRERRKGRKSVAFSNSTVPDSDPETSGRRKTRRSVAVVEDTTVTKDDDVASLETATTEGQRKTRRSIAAGNAAVGDSQEKTYEVEKMSEVEETTKGRRKTRRSIAAGNATVDEEKTSKVEETIKGGRKSRRSIASVSVSEAKMDDAGTTAAETSKARRKSRRSVAVMETEAKADSTGSEAEATETKQSRRKSRRSLPAGKDSCAETEVKASNTTVLAPVEETEMVVEPEPQNVESDLAPIMQHVEAVVTITNTPVAAVRNRLSSRRSLVAAETGKEPTTVDLEALRSPEIPLTGTIKNIQPMDVDISSKPAALLDSAVFATPATPPSVARSRHRARSMMSGSSMSRKTPKNLRNSLILRTLSPEESVEILKNSPMIEMTRGRRTPKDSKSNLPTIPLPDFSDVDEYFSSTASDTANSSYVGNSTGNSPPGQLLPALEQRLKPEQAQEPMAMDTDCAAATLSTMDNKDSTASSAPEPVKRVEPVSAEADSTTAVQAVATEEEHDVPYFRRLLRSETERLNGLCDSWTSKDEAAGLPEEVCGQIRTSVGCAQLLIAQRFKQFSGLVDNCEFNTGEKPISCTDLQGFWDMVNYQVEDVATKFIELDKLEAHGWKSEKPKPVQKKKVIKKKPAASATAKPSAKSKFADFRARMKQQQQVKEIEAVQIEGDNAAPAVSGAQPAISVLDVEGVDAVESVKTFDAGFFKVHSPVHSPRPHCGVGSPSYRRSRSGSHTPAVSPLLRSVLHRSTRRSCGVKGQLAVESPRSAGLKRKLSEEEGMQVAPAAVGTPGQAKRMKGGDGDAPVMTPVRHLEHLARSIFTPNSGSSGSAGSCSTRRSVRLSNMSVDSLDVSLSKPALQPEANAESNDVLSKYLVASEKPDVTRSTRQRSVGGLASDRHLGKSVSGRRRSRRSLQVSPTMPLTPFRKVLQISDLGKENVRSDAPSDTPATQLSKLTMDSTPVDNSKPQTPTMDSLLFTPFQKMATPAKNDTDLMGFSPLLESGSEDVAATEASQ